LRRGLRADPYKDGLIDGLALFTLFRDALQNKLPPPHPPSGGALPLRGKYIAASRLTNCVSSSLDWIRLGGWVGLQTFLYEKYEVKTNETRKNKTITNYMDVECVWWRPYGRRI